MLESRINFTEQAHHRTAALGHNSRWITARYVMCEKCQLLTEWLAPLITNSLPLSITVRDHHQHRFCPICYVPKRIPVHGTESEAAK